MLCFDIHQDIGAGVVVIGVDDQVEFHILRVAEDDDRVEIGLSDDFEPENGIERDGAFGVADPDAEMVDALDGDGIGRHSVYSAASFIGPWVSRLDGLPPVS